MTIEKWILFHFFIIILIIFFFYPSAIPNNENLLNFDAFWYFDITNQGYLYVPNIGNNLAFFPAFPLLWGLLRLTPLGISLFNYSVFCTTFIILLKKLKTDFLLSLIFISIPSYIFFALPYSESIFFFFCTLIIGYQKNKKFLLYIGLFGASTIRSTSFMFVPAILISELILVRNFVEDKQAVIRRILYQLVACLSGFMLASAYMGFKSGKWFYFFYIQKFWNRHWQLPRFPLTTVRAPNILGLDAIAFTIGLLSTYYCGKCLFFKIKNRGISSYSSVDTAVVFSAIVLSLTWITDLFFTYNLGNNTNIWSLNRHLLCTPFSVIFLSYLYKSIQSEKLVMIIVMFSFILGMFLTGIYNFLTIESLGLYLSFMGTFFSIDFFQNIILTHYILLVTTCSPFIYK